MKTVGGTGLVIIGFVFLYLAISGKLDCLWQFISCITGGSLQSDLQKAAQPTSGLPFNLPQIPKLPSLPIIQNFQTGSFG